MSFFLRCSKRRPLTPGLALENTHGVTLTVPISTTLTKVYALEPTFSSRRDAKEQVTRQALRDGVPALYEEAFKERLQIDTGGYISFNGGEGAVALDPVAVLGKDTATVLGSQKPLVYITTTREPDTPEGVLLFLRLYLHSSH